MFFASFYNKIAPHIGAVKVLSICGFLCNHKLKKLSQVLMLLIQQISVLAFDICQGP